MEVFYDELNKMPQQIVDVAFIGGMLRTTYNPYNQIKATDAMTYNNQG